MARVAGLASVAPAFLSQMASGLRPVPAERAVDIERACAFEVRRWDLRPHDWHRIWPELIGAEGAPAAPGQPPVDSLPQALPPLPRPEDPAAPLKLMTPDEAALRVRDAYLNGSGVPDVPALDTEASDAA